MPLNGDILGALIKSSIDGVADKTDRDAIFKAMGAAIVSHIQTAGTVVVVSVAGVTPGPGVSGPGTGTIV